MVTSPSLIFHPSFAENQPPHDTPDQMKLFLAHTSVFVESIWKSKSGWCWFLFVMSLGLSVATQTLFNCWGPSLIFNQSFAENQPHMTPLLA
jgi:hypothetical protein